MSDKQLIHRYYDELEIKYAKSDSYLKLADRLDVEGAPEIKIDELRNYFRLNWKPAPIDIHLKNLKSGLYCKLVALITKHSGNCFLNILVIKSNLG